MKKALLILLISSCAQYALASEEYFVEIKSFRNDIQIGNPRIITTLENAAEVRQTAGEYYLSKKVLFQKTNSSDLVKLTLNIDEHLPQTSFKMNETSEIRKEGDHKTLSLDSGGNLYRYEIDVKLLP